MPLAMQRGLVTPLVGSQGILLPPGPPILLQPGWAGRTLPPARSLQGNFLEIAGFIFSHSSAAQGWEGMGSGGWWWWSWRPVQHGALATGGPGGPAPLCVCPIAAGLASSWLLWA